MNNKRYSDFMDDIKAPQAAVDKAVEAMYESKTQPRVSANKPKHRGYRSVAATAAVLCLVLLAGIVCYPFGTKGVNMFVINVGAAEVNTYELTKLGELKCEFNSLGLGFNEENEVTSITVCETLDFPITCTGEGIEEVTYKMNGNGFFFLPDVPSQFYDKLYLEDSSEFLPYSDAVLSNKDGGHIYFEKVSSFTTDFPEFCQDLLLCLYTSDTNGTYCKKYNEGYIVESDGIAHGKNMDYQQMYYELFSADEHWVEVTVNFDDGTTQTKTIDLFIEKSDAEKDSTLTVSAKLAE